MRTINHSHRCLIHAQQNKVGVCAVCLRERLVALDEGHDSPVGGGGGRRDLHVNDCHNHHNVQSSSSSSSNHLINNSAQLAPDPAPAPAAAAADDNLDLRGAREDDDDAGTCPPTAHKEKEGGLMSNLVFTRRRSRQSTSVPQSPDRFTFHHQRRSVSAWASPNTAIAPAAHAPEFDTYTAHRYTHHRHSIAAAAAAETHYHPQPHDPVPRRKRTSLFSLFHQTSTPSEHLAAKSQFPPYAPPNVAAKSSPGFSSRLRGAAVSDYKQAFLADLAGINNAGQHSAKNDHAVSNSTSWISNLLHRKGSSSKHGKMPPKPSRSSANSNYSAETHAYINGLFEASARPSMDATAPPPPQRLAAARRSASLAEQPPLVKAHFSAQEPSPPSHNKLAHLEDNPTVSGASHAENYKFSRSRSWGWSKTLASPLWSSSSKPPNAAANEAPKQYASTPQHPSSATGKPPSTFGFYFSPLRRIRHAAGGSIQFPH